MADMIIETPIDELARILNERKKISLSEAAKLLKTNETQVEEWVKILEEHGFVELIYPALGEPQIVLKSLEKKELVKKKKEIENRKEAVEEKTKDFEKKVDVVEKKVELSNKDFLRLENELKDKLSDLEKELKNIDILEGKKDELIKKAEEVKAVTDAISKKIEDIKNEIIQMEKSINDHIKTVEGHEIDIKNLDESKKIIENEIISLENDIKIIKVLIKRPITAPLINIKKIFAKHKERTKKISQKRSKIHEKALKMKSIVNQKKDHIQKKEIKHRKFLNFLKR